MQRPEFVIAEKLVQSQGLHATKHHIPGLFILSYYSKFSDVAGTEIKQCILITICMLFS